MELSPLATGAVFAEDFEVEALLGAGGMGAVYRVRQRSTGEHRALKVMQPFVAADPRSRSRFEQEARIGARIRSEHVVKVVAAGVDAPSGMPWLAMEHLRGETLAERVERAGPLPWEALVPLMRQLGHALRAAHAEGIVHRDLKPENLFVAETDRADVASSLKVLDFGIAKLLGETRGPTMAIGTPLWMSPEQAQPGSSIDVRADVWALGLVAFHALTGKVFWLAAQREGAPITQLITEILVSDIPSASERARELGVDAAVLPAGFDAWLARCVARDREARHEDGGAAIDALLALGSAARDGEPPKKKKKKRRPAAPERELTLEEAAAILPDTRDRFDHGVVYVPVGEPRERPVPVAAPDWTLRTILGIGGSLFFLTVLRAPWTILLAPSTRSPVSGAGSMVVALVGYTLWRCVRVLSVLPILRRKTDEHADVPEPALWLRWQARQRALAELYVVVAVWGVLTCLLFLTPVGPMLMLEIVVSNTLLAFTNAALGHWTHDAERRWRKSVAS